MTIRSFAASKPVMFTVAARPSTVTPPCRRRRPGSTSSPLVALMTIVSAAPSPAPPARREVDVDLGDVGAGQVVDDDGVGAAERVEVDASRRR